MSSTRHELSGITPSCFMCTVVPNEGFHIDPLAIGGPGYHNDRGVLALFCGKVVTV